MANQQKKIFTKGINSDVTNEFMEDGQDRYRLNVRALSSNNSTVGAIETVNGNTLVSFSLPSGDNTVIGSREDLLRRKLYYFVFNSLSNHSILQYDEVLNTITTVFQSSILNFKITHLITGINIVNLDENNNLLYWTDNWVDPTNSFIYNEPKKINIEKGIAFTQGDFVRGYKTPFDPLILYRIKQPPLYAPSYAWSNNTSQAINHLFKKLFTFKVQFVYDDKEVSAWSPISNYEFPATTAYSQGTGEDYQTQDNTITITVPTGISIVTRIRIAGKQLGKPDFALVADLNKSQLSIADNTTYNYTFINDGNYVTLEINESIKLFDNVPKRSQAQEIIQGSRITDGLITEGFDPVNVDMKLPITYVEASFPANPFYPNQQYLKSGGIYKYGIVYYDEQGNRSGATNILQGNSLYIVPGDNKYGTTLYVPFLTDPLYNPGYTGIPYLGMSWVPSVNAEIYNRPPSWATHYQILRSKNEAITKFIQFDAQGVQYLDIDGNVTSASAAYYLNIDIGNIAGRYKTENPTSMLVYDFTPGDRIRFIANKTGAGNDFSEILPFFGFNDTSIDNFNSATGILRVTMTDDIPQGAGSLQLQNGCLFEIYTPAEVVINNNELMYEVSEEFDLGTDIHGNIIHKGGLSDQLIASFTSATYTAPPTFIATLPLGHGLLVNDLVKVVTDDGSYSVYGEVTVSGATSVTIITSSILVGTFNGSSSGSIIKSAVSTLSGGDCFRRLQDMPWVDIAVYRLYMFVEAQSASNLFLSNADDYGRPNRIDPEFKEITRPSTIYYSEKLIAETNINGLSSVFDTNFESYSSTFGGIYKLYYENLKLFCFQELKIGVIPVNQIIYNDLNLNNTVGASSAILSPQEVYYEGEFGIGVYPESFAVYANAKYGIDVRRGVIWRLSNDGLIPISTIGDMKTYVGDKCRLILSSPTKTNIYGIFDVRFGEYIISFADVPSITPAETLAWNEKYNQFSTFYSYTPEYFGHNGIDIVSFVNGSLYTHNTNPLQNTFYGTNVPSQIWMIGNLEPSNVKVFESISQETNQNWLIPSITGEQYFLNGNPVPKQQETRIVYDSNWITKENNQYAFVKRDINTPNVSNPIITGNPMRDRTFLVKMTYDKTSYNKLFAVNFYFIDSQRSNK